LLYLLLYRRRLGALVLIAVASSARPPM